MKILMLLSKSYITDPRVTKEVKALSKAGNEVVVIIWNRKPYKKSEEIIDGIRIININNTGLMKVLPKHIYRNPFWWRKAYKKGLKLYENGFDFEVVHCHDLDTLPAGVWLKKNTKCKLVYDAHEIFGYMILGQTLNIVVKAAFWIEKRLIKYVDHVITVCKPAKTYFQSITKKPVSIIMNCNKLQSRVYLAPPKNDFFTICYIGGFVESRMFPDLIDIIGSIKDVKFLVAGYKSVFYKEVKKRSEKYNNVEFLGTIPSKEAIPKTLESNAVICMLDPDRKTHQIGLPNKLFEAMVCSRPIIATKNMYYSNEIVEKEQCGLSVLNTANEIKKAITTLRDNPQLSEKLGKNALNAAIRKYNWKKQEEKLLKIYGDLK